MPLGECDVGRFVKLMVPDIFPKLERKESEKYRISAGFQAFAIPEHVLDLVEGLPAIVLERSSAKIAAQNSRIETRDPSPIQRFLEQQ